MNEKQKYKLNDSRIIFVLLRVGGCFLINLSYDQNVIIVSKFCLLCTGIIFSPNPDELVKMVSSKNRRISCQVIKVIHNDSDEQVQHEERTEENEGHKISIGEGGATGLVRIDYFACRLVILKCPKSKIVTSDSMLSSLTI